MAKRLRVVHDKPINVDGERREPGESFDDPKSGDIKALIANGYLVEES